MQKMLLVVSIALALTACDGSQSQNFGTTGSTVVDGVHSDESCSAEIVSQYNDFNDTYQQPTVELKHEYNEEIERYGICQNLGVNVSKGTVCSVQNGKLDFSTLRSACAEATETKNAVDCDQAFLAAYDSIENGEMELNQLILINIDHHFDDTIATTTKALNAQCDELPSGASGRSFCLDEDFNADGHAGQFIVKPENLQASCDFVKGL
jgi:hypothetical protein